MITIQQLAAQYTELFITKTRDNGDRFLHLHDSVDDNHPLHKLVYNAHDGMMPDDYKYQFVLDSLNDISESDDTYDIYLEADCYTSNVLKWLSSNLTRLGYCDEALERSYNLKSISELITAGQQIEMEEVLDSVRTSLQPIVDNINNQEEVA